MITYTDNPGGLWAFKRKWTSIKTGLHHLLLSEFHPVCWCPHHAPPTVTVLLNSYLPHCHLGPLPVFLLSWRLTSPFVSPQIPCAHHLSWHHGPRRSQTETHRRQNPRILFLKCKELLIKKTARRKSASVLCFVSPMVSHQPYDGNFAGIHTEEAVWGCIFFFSPQAINDKCP